MGHQHGLLSGGRSGGGKIAKGRQSLVVSALGRVGGGGRPGEKVRAALQAPADVSFCVRGGKMLTGTCSWRMCRGSGLS